MNFRTRNSSYILHQVRLPVIDRRVLRVFSAFGESVFLFLSCVVIFIFEVDFEVVENLRNMSATYKTIFKISILLIMVANQEIFGRPGAEWRNRYACETDQNLKEICQRCAKQTKSNVVYPMCCNQEEEVHNWCLRYTNFGKVA